MSSSDTISQIEVFAIIRSTMNELEKIADDVQVMRDELYKFLDEHYDFSDKELVARLKEVGLML
jgi:DNA-binding phage protein